MAYWFTSDTHFYHKNIVDYSDRPFKSVEHMNEVLINNWNSVVKPGDTVYHLGDFGSSSKNASIKARLNGTIIHIQGNHDKSSDTILKDAVIEIGGHHWHLVHDPQDANGEYNLVGHVHKSWKSTRIISGKKFVGWAINVGVDQWHYKPIQITAILKELEHLKANNDANIPSVTKL